VDITLPEGGNPFVVGFQSTVVKFSPFGLLQDFVFFKTEEGQPGNATGLPRLMAIQGIVDINLVGPSNFTTVLSGGTWKGIGVTSGSWNGVSSGDQDHGTGNDGFDIYIPNGATLLDMEYKGTGDVFDSTNYNLTTIFDARKLLKRVNGGIIMCAVPPVDINGNGRKEVVVGWQTFGPDTLLNAGREIPVERGVVPFWVIEWGDTTLATITEVKPLEFITPDNYTLEQNYPNPFNPSTSIKFGLPIENDISLVVYDINGREVKRLINSERYKAGNYEVNWNGTNSAGQPVASGTYIYELRFGNFTKTMKMTLLK
jgi:hypothetical protein